jgi:4-carboxymuconolactone decarboxylase
MEDIHAAFTVFKSEFPGLYEKIDASGRAVQVEGGPLDERTRALLRVAIAASSGRQQLLETQLAVAREVGVTEPEVLHALLLLIPTCGFPTFMEGYSTYKGM